MSVILYAIMLSNMVTMLTPGSSISSDSGNNELKVGSEVPKFILPDQNGKMFDLRRVLGKENLVIYFYVKDETPGCTKEACTFRDDYTQFQKDNAVVIGISAQSVKSHKEFAEKYNLPFTLLSDDKNRVRRLFGVKDVMGSIPGRETFVVDKQGKIVYIFNSNSKPVEHVTEAMRILNGIS
jgi:peroxiredoxin Q/BCP